MHDYRKTVEYIRVPEGLNDRVLTAAHKQETSHRQRSRTFLRGAVCAACAALLLMGTVSVGEPEEPVTVLPDESVDISSNFPVLNYSFGISACAADNAVNGGLVFRWENGCGSFRIRGENIQEIYLDTSKGVLVRNGSRLGSCVRETFDSDAVYGLSSVNGEDVAELDQAELCLQVIFTDGTRKEERYTLQAEKLRAFFNEDGTEVLVPALEGDSSGNIPALYMDGAEGRWLEWPAEGCRTVSLSMDYGMKARWTGDTPLFHSGIDIPGERGMKIVAAEAGKVTEKGYDSRQGNYLVVEHGDGLSTVYAHCQEVLVGEGEVLVKGQEIALLGSTGMSTGPHLHFEVRQDGSPQNPIAYFTGTIRDTLCAQ